MISRKFEDEDEDENGGDWNMPGGSIGRFLSLRQLAGRPITIVNTEAEFVQASVQTQPLAQPERGR